MPTINGFMESSCWDCGNGRSSNSQKSDLFLSGVSVSMEGGFNLSDHMAIKNGSYKKLLKAYYKKQDADKPSSGDTKQKRMLLESGADSLAQSAKKLMDGSLWEKKQKTVVDEKTGEKKIIEDYDWDGITKAVKSFVKQYNQVVEEAGSSDTKSVLRNGVWLTGMTKENKKMLEKIGIKVGEGNKLELDEEALKKADITVCKALFTGYGSYGSQVGRRAESIAMAAARGGSAYTRSGAYTKSLPSLASSRVDQKS